MGVLKIMNLLLESIPIAWIMNILTSLMDMIEMTSIYKWHKDECGHIVDQSYVHIKEKERPSNLEEPFIWTH